MYVSEMSDKIPYQKVIHLNRSFSCSTDKLGNGGDQISKVRHPCIGFSMAKTIIGSIKYITLKGNICNYVTYVTSRCLHSSSI